MNPQESNDCSTISIELSNFLIENILPMLPIENIEINPEDDYKTQRKKVKQEKANDLLPTLLNLTYNSTNKMYRYDVTILIIQYIHKYGWDDLKLRQLFDDYGYACNDNFIYLILYLDHHFDKSFLL